MNMNNFFNDRLAKTDTAVMDAINAELNRQQNNIELIASENIVSQAVIDAQGSVLTNKYAEGYPSKRYYGGCEHVDVVEQLAIDRAKELFGADYVNVQPHSGSQANQEVYFALLNPGDKIMGLALDQGGHLTHGHKVNQSGKWFEAHSYGLNDEALLDYEAIMAQAKEVQPQLIIAGFTCYPRAVDWQKFREIADAVGAYLMCDIAHISGLVATGAHASPLDIADVVTTTTHKTLRGPRGGMIMSNKPDVAEKIQRAVFPGMQGGPLMHVIAGKAVAFGEALAPSFKGYIDDVVSNARALAASLEENGLRVVTGGTDTHKLLVDLTPFNVTGKDAEKVLDKAGLTTNKNTIPGDPNGPFVTSGLRLGSPAGTSRGFGTAEFTQIGAWIAEVLKAHSNGDDVTTRVAADVQALCARFPVYATSVAQAA